MACVSGSRHPNDNNTCLCDYGYYGSNCSSLCPGGTENTCSGYGTCDVTTGVCPCPVSRRGSADCSSCQSGWEGTDCVITSSSSSIATPVAKVAELTVVRNCLDVVVIVAVVLCVVLCSVVCVCVCVCVCVRARARVRACIRLCVFLSVCICMCVCVCTCVLWGGAYGVCGGGGGGGGGGVCACICVSVRLFFCLFLFLAFFICLLIVPLRAYACSKEFPRTTSS